MHLRVNHKHRLETVHKQWGFPLPTLVGLVYFLYRHEHGLNSRGTIQPTMAVVVQWYYHNSTVVLQK